MDAQVARREDPGLRELMERFVCVRVVRMKRKELGLFQFDWDQSWSCMFLNGDEAVYGRYGTRTGKDGAAEERTSIAGLRRSMEGVLELHAAWPANKAALKDKRGPGFSGRDVEDLPYFRGRVTDDANSGCIHCHQVWEGVRDEWRAQKKELTDEQLFIWPVPDLVGLSLDVNERATVASVAKDSAAAQAGFREGDRIATAGGQPIVSPADVQWVLHRAKAPGAVPFEVRRGEERLTLTLALAKDWRRGTDLSWRHSSFILRMRFRSDDLPDAERKERGIASDALALKVRGVDGKSEAARQGLRAGDVIAQVDDRKARWTETEFLAYLNQQLRRGEKVTLQVLGKRKLVLKAP